MSLCFLEPLLASGWVQGSRLSQGTSACWMFVRGRPAIQRGGSREVGQCCHYPVEAGVAFGVVLSCSRRSGCRASGLSAGHWIPAFVGKGCDLGRGGPLQPRAASAEDKESFGPCRNAPFSPERGSEKRRVQPVTITPKYSLIGLTLNLTWDEAQG